MLVAFAFALATGTACGDDAPPAPPHDAGVRAEAPRPEAGGGGFIIEVACHVGTAVELEDNDTPATANAFTELSFCGSITPATDVDYSTFKTPEGKKLALFQA